MMNWEIVEFEMIASTNDLLKEWGRGEATEGTVIYTQSQTAGRGRFERKWHSPMGLGLYFSMLLRPPSIFTSFELLTMLASVPIGRVIGEHYGIDVCYKFPNDLFVEGRKLGGILGESIGRGMVNPFMVMGVGINCLGTEADYPAAIRDTAISLYQLGNKGCQPRELLDWILEGFTLLYQDVLLGRTDDWIEGYQSKCISIGKPLVQGETLGIMRGINEKGELIVEMEDGDLVSWGWAQ